MAPNQIYYDINQNTDKIKQDLLKIWRDILVRFFKKFEYLLVRPSLVAKLDSQIRNIKQNIQRDFIVESKTAEVKPEKTPDRFEKLNYTENIIYYI